MFFHLEIQKTAIFTFSGALNENSIVNELVSAIQTLHKKKPETVLEFDMLELQSANSMGLLNLQRGLKLVELPIIYSKVPYWLINHFSLINSFPQEKLFYVKSFYLPYFSETESEETLSLKQVGVDFTLENMDFSHLEKPLTMNGIVFEPDFIIEKIEKFFRSNLEVFSGFQSKYREFI